MFSVSTTDIDGLEYPTSEIQRETDPCLMLELFSQLVRA